MTAGEHGQPPRCTVVFADSAVVSPGASRNAELRWRGELPHLETAGGTYFVTFCLASAPRAGGRVVATAADDAEAVARASEPTGSASEGLALTGAAGEIVEDAVLHFNGDRFGLHAWCVMPNHVHVVLCPYGECRLPAILHSWKSYTAKAIGRSCGWPGSVWEREYFDHLVRSVAALERFVSYAEMNPVTAGLCAAPNDWPLSSARFPR